jgi:putative salt-induced outer membrane protein
MWKRTLAVLPLAAALNGVAHAQTAWTSHSEAGFVMARGNTDTESANAKFEIARALGQWKYTYGFDALYANSSGIRTAQRWATHFQTDHKLSEQAFWFGALRYEDDAFSGFAYQYSLSAGAGRDFIKTDSTKLSAQLGAGFRRLRPALLVRDDRGAVIQRIPADSIDDAVANAAVSFEHAFNSSSKVTDSFLIESGQNNTMTQNNFSLQARMNATLALAVGLTFRSNSNPPPGLTRRTDTLTTLNLVYEVKNSSAVK